MHVPIDQAKKIPTAETMQYMQRFFHHVKSIFDAFGDHIPTEIANKIPEMKKLMEWKTE